jgi:hypothetical protein
MRVIASAALLGAVAACSSPSSPVERQPRPDAVAFIHGTVVDAAGGPLAVGAVTVRCADGAVGGTLAATAEGQFGGTLHASRDALGGEAARIPCRFTASPAGAGEISRDATVGFGPAGLPHPLQRVELRVAP